MSPLGCHYLLTHLEANLLVFLVLANLLLFLLLANLLLGCQYLLTHLEANLLLFLLANLLLFLLLANLLLFLLMNRGVLLIKMDLHGVVHNFFILLVHKYAVTTMYTLFSAYPFSDGILHVHLLVQKALHGCHVGKGTMRNRCHR
jgi:hypothetical protein